LDRLLITFYQEYSGSSLFSDTGKNFIFLRCTLLFFLRLKTGYLTMFLLSIKKRKLTVYYSRFYELSFFFINPDDYYVLGEYFEINFFMNGVCV